MYRIVAAIDSRVPKVIDSQSNAFETFGEAKTSARFFCDALRRMGGWQTQDMEDTGETFYRMMRKGPRMITVSVVTRHIINERGDVG